MTKDLTIEEARALSGGRLGRTMLETAIGYAAPLWWVEPSDDGRHVVRNGSAFFLDCGRGPFLVTAGHVFSGYLEARRDRGAGLATVGTGPGPGPGEGLEVDLEERLIAHSSDPDVATFRVAAGEPGRSGCVVLTGHGREWPPPPPEEGRGVFFAGFPGLEVLRPGPRVLSFGALAGMGVATDVGSRSIWSQFERGEWTDVFGLGLPPEDYNMGGLSGGPLLAVVEHLGVMSWRLGGVICEASSQLAEGMFAARADFIGPRGELTA
ncbi:MAG: hypothetical protein P1P84_15270 [Deferrisomatales bacterium]|nr:hypothetical protein [Deferrisomatales bacterium]